MIQDEIGYNSHPAKKFIDSFDQKRIAIVNMLKEVADILSNRSEDKKINAFVNYLYDKDLGAISSACEYAKTSLTQFPSLAEFLQIVAGHTSKSVSDEDQHKKEKEKEVLEYERRKEIFLKEFSQDQLDQLTKLWIGLVGGKRTLLEIEKWGLALSNMESPALAELESNYWNPVRMKEKMLTKN